jgi:hypothetical protein
MKISFVECPFWISTDITESGLVFKKALSVKRRERFSSTGFSWKSPETDVFSVVVGCYFLGASPLVV